MSEWVLVKWGGSLITDKAGTDALRTDVLTRLAAEFARAHRGSALNFFLGHGGGSFGHVAAAEAGLNRGPLAESQWSGVCRTQDRAATLHRHVMAALALADVSAYSLVASSFAMANEGVVELPSPVVLDAALSAPPVPVLYGDVVLDRGWGASIASTEALMGLAVQRILERGDRVRCLVWMGETSGVLDAGGATIPRLLPAQILADQLEISATRGTDVTGGMGLRLRTAAQWASIGIPSWIVNGTNADALAAILADRPVPGTCVG